MLCLVNKAALEIYGCKIYLWDLLISSRNESGQGTFDSFTGESALRCEQGCWICQRDRRRDETRSMEEATEQLVKGWHSTDHEWSCSAAALLINSGNDTCPAMVFFFFLFVLFVCFFYSNNSIQIQLKNTLLIPEEKLNCWSNCHDFCLFKYSL